MTVKPARIVCEERDIEPSGPPVLYVRAPGLLACVARVVATPSTVPVVVSDGRQVRDACALAHAHGIREGQMLTHARRQCPWLLAVPFEELDRRRAESLTRRLLLDPLADATPTVEPDREDAAWADLSGCPPALARELPARLAAALQHEPGIAPLVGVGVSRLAARACAECRLPGDRLAEADAARWLWPEDPAVGARLARLGLAAFGDVARAGEAALVHVFGAKQGRLLHRRAANGQDFAPPVRALYPPPVVTLTRRFSESPLADRQSLDTVLNEMMEAAASELRKTGLFARRVTLSLRCEDDSREHAAAWTVPTPVRTASDLAAVVPVLLRRLLPGVRTPILHLCLTADDLTLPTAASGDLFTTGRARHRETLDATRRLLTERHGPKTLRHLAELPVDLRDTRRSLVREEQGHP